MERLSFRAGPQFARFFDEVRPFVPAIQEMRHYERTAVRDDGASVPSLYERAGGEAAFQRLTLSALRG